MKDQKAILLNCRKRNEPAFIIAGHDKFAIPTLTAYRQAAIDYGASHDFIEDLQHVINEIIIFQQQEPGTVRIPDLTDGVLSLGPVDYLLNCIKRDVPAFVISGHDKFAIPTLIAYRLAAIDYGVRDEFLDVRQRVIHEFTIFQQQEPGKIRIPDLDDGERWRRGAGYPKAEDLECFEGLNSQINVSYEHKKVDN